jgi:hypothetical protein
MSSVVYRSPDVELDYYLVVLHPSEQRVLLMYDDDEKCYGLPHFIPEEQQMAVVGHILRAARMRTGLKASVLRCIATNYDDKRGQRYYALETLQTITLPSTARWLTSDEVKERTDIPEKQKKVVQDWFEWANKEPDAPLRVPWAKRGWYRVVEDWMLDLAERLDMNPAREVEQYRAWARSCTMRLKTLQGGNLYFKAVPLLFSYEPVLTRVLSLRYRGQIPEVLAVNVDKAWMLTRGVSGNLLRQQSDIEVWKRVLRDFAGIQIDLTDNTHSLIALGVPDRNVDYLASQVERLMVDLPPEINLDERQMLKRSVFALRNLCYDLMDYNLPLSLTHGDFWAGNVIIRDDGLPVFFDWSDSTVSHPFFDIPYFLSELETYLPRVPDARQQLLNAYLEPWTRYKPMRVLQKIYALAEVISNLHQVVNYMNLVLPNVEPAVRWEMANVPPMVLRQMLAALRMFTP